MTLYLIDGTFELYRCFHASPRQKSPDGVEVGATIGFAHTMASLLRQDDLTHVAVAFDAVASRVSGRDRSDDALLKRQYPFAAAAARALGMTVWPLVRFSADEALATGAASFQSTARRVVIGSADKDFWQCVRGDQVVVWNRVSNVWFDEEAVVARLGVPPTLAPSWFALVGDPSDGVAGVPGIGAKRATALLQRYGSLEELPADVHNDWDVLRLETLLCRDLLTLRRDVPLPHSFAALAYAGAPQVRWEQLLAQLGSEELAQRTVRFA